MATSDPNNTAKEVTQATGAEASSQYMPRARRPGAHDRPPQRCAANRRRGRRRFSGRAAPAGPRRRRTQRGDGADEHRGGRGATGSLPNTPAPLASWMAALAGKGGFPADAQIAVSTPTSSSPTGSGCATTTRPAIALGSRPRYRPPSSCRGLSLKDAAGNTIDRFNDLRVSSTRIASGSGSPLMPASAARRTCPPPSAAPSSRWRSRRPRTRRTAGISTIGTAPPRKATRPARSGSRAMRPTIPIIGIDKLAITITHAVNNGGFRYWRVTLTPADPLAERPGAGRLAVLGLKNPDGSTPWVITPAVHHGSPKGGRATGSAARTRTRSSSGRSPIPSTRPGRSSTSPSRSPQPSGPGQRPAEGLDEADQVHQPGYCGDEGLFSQRAACTWSRTTRTTGAASARSGRSIRYVRLPVTAWPSVPAPPGVGGVSRVFGGGNPNEEIDGLKHYGWAAVEANKNGDAIIGYARTGEKLIPRSARAHTWQRRQTSAPAARSRRATRRGQSELPQRQRRAAVGRHVGRVGRSGRRHRHLDRSAVCEHDRQQQRQLRHLGREVLRRLAVRGASPASHRDARCARPARRAEREYRLYLTEAQRRRAGCSARRMQRELHYGLLAGASRPCVIDALKPVDQSSWSSVMGWFPRYNSIGTRLTSEEPGKWQAQWITDYCEIWHDGSRLDCRRRDHQSFRP